MGVNETLDVSNNLIATEFDNEKDFQDYSTKEDKEDSCCRTLNLNKAVNFLKFIAMGQHATKFYRNKNSRYSSVVGGLLSFVLYIVIFFLILF